MGMSLSDVTSAVDLVQRVDANPARLASRVVGLGTEEARKLPDWSICAAAVLVGFTGVLLLAPAFSRAPRRVTPNTRVFS